ncbi:zinc finger protein 2 homolog [Elysia marginata]|uniref:Zinc finger protein 2 homolog n=1 Tax=Elysia marginata TaxID=1093978 RepID=A0AAV4GF84_9GAST|nr:zinc finger protein 2 homolog [Elysia marginata]
MEGNPTVDEKTTSSCLFVEEEQNVQALQIKQEPLAPANGHGSCCFSKNMDWNLDENQTLPHEHAGTCLKPPVDTEMFQGGNSREQNLLLGAGSLHIKHPGHGFETVFPEYSPVKNELCLTTDDGDLMKTDQSERDLTVKTEEEASIARLQAHLKTYSSTVFTDIKQETPENVEDCHETPQEHAVLERDRDITSSSESENLQKTSSFSTQRQLGCDQGRRESFSSDLPTESKEANSHVYIGDSYSTDLEIGTDRASVVNTLRTLDAGARLSSRPTETMALVDLEQLQQDADGEAKCYKFRAKMCFINISDKKELSEHKRTHIVEKSYKCDVCGEGFTQQKELSEHKRTHSGEKPYKCDVCGKGFSQKQNLSVHKRMHSGEMPYKCGVCEKAFVKSSLLTSHMRTHSGEKPYKCGVCGMAFIKSSTLTNHMRTHSGEKPFKCDVCGKGFSQKQNLLAHERIHSGEKPYKCDVCGKAFGKNSSLTSHLRIHSGEKPYNCDVCGKAFSYRSSLNAHTRTHNG